MTSVLLQACPAPNGSLSFYTLSNSGGPDGGNLNLNSFSWSGLSSIATNHCTSYMIASLAPNGTLLTATQPVAVALVNSGGGTFYSDSSCAIPTSVVSIPSNATSVMVFFSSGSSSTSVFEAYSNGYQATSYSVDVVAPGTPFKLSFGTEPPTTAQSGATFATSPSVKVLDIDNNLVTSGASVTVSVAAYSNVNCTTLASGSFNTTSTTTAGGFASFASLNFTAPASETIYIGASSSGLNSACSSAISITPLVVTPMVVAGDGATCALSSIGNVYCWGNNNSGQLGNGHESNIATPVSVVGVGGIDSLSGIVSISGNSESDYFCATSVGGNAYCWGENDSGQLGSGSYTGIYPTPVEVLSTSGSGVLSNVTSVSVGIVHACALTSAGNVYCWGDGGVGELGNNSSISSALPVEVLAPGAASALSNVTSIAAGGAGSCAVKAGNVYCWGAGTQGNLGNNSTANELLPVEVVSTSGTGALSGIASVSMSDNYGACAVSSAGNVYCWGPNNFDQVSNTGSYFLVPVEIVGQGGSGNLSNVTSISYGQNEVCAVSSGGGAYCWGEGEDGSLGNNTTTTASSSPVAVLTPSGATTLTGATSITVSQDASNGYACVVSAGKVYCWGTNVTGELGQSSTNSLANKLPLEVLGVDGVNFLSL